MTTSPATSLKRGAEIIRPYRDEDADQACALHQQVFPNAMPAGTTGDQFGAHLRELTEGNPWRSPEIGPMVLEDSQGRVCGFVCVSPRRIRFGDRVLLGAVVSDLCIAKEHRGFGGAQMLRVLIDGPQDFLFTDEANDISAMISARLGCTVYQTQSVRWTLPLRPARLALSFSLNRLGVGRAYAAGVGMAMAADILAKKLPEHPAHHPVNGSLTQHPMDVDEIAASLPRVLHGYGLRMDYDRESLKWILGRAGRMTQAGQPRMTMLRDADGSVAGWYVYYLRERGLSDVVSLVARPRYRRDVFDRMIKDAWDAGASGLTGRLDPDIVEIIANRYCLFQPHPRWMVVHAREPKLVQTVLAGGALLTRLDGEWIHHFASAPATD